MSFPKYAVYKDSGVEWLGEVPEHWDSKRLKFIFNLVKRGVRDEDHIVTCFRDGIVTLRDNRRTEGFTNALKEIGYQGIRIGDLIIHAMDAFAGAIGVSDSDGKSSPVYSVCVPVSESISANYYARLLRHMALAGFVTSLAKGIRERSTDFRWSDVGEISLPIPSAQEQIQIARFLDRETTRIDALIAEQQRLIELLKEKRQAVISHAVTKGIDRTVPMKDSSVEWLGEVPEHWKVTRFYNLCESITTGPFGTVLGNDDYVSDGIPVINPSHIKDGVCVPSSDITVSEDMARELSTRSMRPGDIVTARRGELGRAAVITEEQDGWICGTGSFRIRPNKQKVISYYIHLVLQSQYAREWLNLSSVGSTMSNLNEGILGRLPVVYSDSIDDQWNLLNQLSLQLKRLSDIEMTAANSISLLQERRSALISAAVTGKIDVRNWQPSPEPTPAHGR
jgi:type I restriction enzyme S subunit